MLVLLSRASDIHRAATSVAAQSLQGKSRDTGHSRRDPNGLTFRGLLARDHRERGRLPW